MNGDNEGIKRLSYFVRMEGIAGAAYGALVTIQFGPLFVLPGIILGFVFGALGGLVGGVVALTIETIGGRTRYLRVIWAFGGILSGIAGGVIYLNIGPWDGKLSTLLNFVLWPAVIGAGVGATFGKGRLKRRQ